MWFLVAMVVIGTAWLSALPYRYSSDGLSMLRVSFRHPGQIVEGCRDATEEEKKNMPDHMRTDKICSRERFPVRLVIELSGETLLDRSYTPGGLQHDWPSVAFEELGVKPGKYHLKARLYESNDSAFNFESEVEFKPGRVVVLDFGRSERKFEILSAS